MNAQPGGYMPAPDLPAREPPHNYDAEQALLGALLTNNLAYGRVSEFLRPDHFAHPAHGRIFDGVQRLIDNNRVANATTLKNLFDQDSDLHEIGGAMYLARLAGSATTVINAGDYGRMIFDLALRRQLIGIGETLVNSAFDHDPDESATKIADAAAHEISTIAASAHSSAQLEPISVATKTAIAKVMQAKEMGGAISGLSTGLIDLDALTGGMSPGELIVLGARPGMGKTALAVKIGISLAKAGCPVSFFSLEMPSQQIARRMLSMLSGVSLSRLKDGRIGPSDVMALQEAGEFLNSIPFFINDAAGTSPQAVRARARMIHRKHGPGLTILDHIQIAGGGQARYGNRVAELTDITKGLKAAAKELAGPMLALSQLNRSLEQRDDKRPTLADLRESGSIEQDADQVWFLYRAEYYHRQIEPDREKEAKKYLDWEADLHSIRGIAELYAAKQRDGEPGRTKLHFDGPTVSFGNLVKQQELV
jgi:replicative DNA helicase